TLGVAEIGDRVQRHLRHCLTEDEMEHEEIVERRRRQAELTCQHLRRLRREAAAIERGVERSVAGTDRARRSVAQHLAGAKVLEIIARAAARHELPAAITCLWTGTRGLPSPRPDWD